MIIYKTTNLKNGKIYIGKDKKNNPKYFGSGVLLKNSIQKYGRENFEKVILEFCNDESHLNEKEIFWIEFYGSNNLEIGYNLTVGGDGNTGNWNGNHLTQDHKNKISESLKKSENFKKWWDGEAKKKLSEARKNSDKVKRLNESEEWRKKISESVKKSERFKSGIANPERSLKIKESMKNSGNHKKATTSEEFRRKCSQWQKGKKRSSEFMEKFIKSRNETISKKREIKKKNLILILEKNNYNIKSTAQEIGITETSVYRQIKLFEITKK